MVDSGQVNASRPNPEVKEEHKKTLVSDRPVQVNYGPATEAADKLLLFATVVEAAPNGIIVVDRKGRILFSNSRAAKIFGYEAGELDQLTVEDLVPQRFRDIHVGHRAAFYENPVPRPMGAGRDLFGVRKDGSEIPVEIGLNPIKIKGELMVLCSILDITERKRSEEQLKDYMNKLEEANAELAEYADVVSHDLRAPLRAIRNYADFLTEDLGHELEQEQREYLEGLTWAVKEADEMTTDLLELSRVGRGMKPLEKVDVHSIVEDVVDMLRLGADTVVHIDDRLPKLQSDPTLLHQIFSNLIRNSAKFNKSAVKEIEIGWRDSDSSHYEFYVKDNGIGIDPKYHDQIFKVFERLHSTKDFEGTGIGLAIVKKAVRKLKGSIRVESKVGQGSTFILTIPRSAENNNGT